jgi:hypothetical protein
MKVRHRNKKERWIHWARENAALISDNLSDPAQAPRKNLIDYYTLTFLYLHSLLPSELKTRSTPHRVRRDFWNLVPDGTYDEHVGRELVLSYAATVERRLADEIKQHSIAYWLHAYRRLAPGSSGPSNSRQTTMIVRSTLEAAVQKYGLLQDCPGIGWSGQVSSEEILGGLPIQLGQRELIDYFRSGPDKHVLTQFGRDEFAQLYRCEKLAYEMWRCGAALRVLSKGADLIVDHGDELCFYDNRTEELNALIENYDSRQQSFIASVTCPGFLIHS